MFSAWLLSAFAAIYLGTLFALAFVGDRRSLYSRSPRLRPYLYGLALGVYCTSWTFFGAVGTAVREGWIYLPIYLGPSLVFILALPFIGRLVDVARAYKVTSIADFIASRFGKSRPLAVLVTLIAVTASIPYLSLQYKAVAASVEALTVASSATVPWYRDTALAVALIMALFAVLFGARRVDASEHREGLMLAIAFESLLKLLAFAAVGIFAWLQWRQHPVALPPQLASGTTLLSADSFTNILLAAAAIFCLPRQFQVGVVECGNSSDLRVARWMLPVYLGVFSAFVLPIVMAGSSEGLATPRLADEMILTLPMAHGVRWLTVLVFLGGLSAATAMVVVSSIALSTMISNDIVAPLLWRQRLELGSSLGRRVLWVRRGVILSLALLAFAYYRATAGYASLAAIGLLAFAAVAQFMPGIIAGLYWNGASRVGVFWGMLAGFAIWAYLLFLPNLFGGAALGSPAFASTASVWPGWLSHFVVTHNVGSGAMLALAVNVLVMVIVSRQYGVSLRERLAARAFIAPRQPLAGWQAIRAQVGDLESVAARIVGPASAHQALQDYSLVTGRPLPGPHDLADRTLLQHFERVLAASLGASSARVVLTHALRRKGLEVDEVAELLDETSQELRFNRQLLQATIENVSQGISVIDHEMRVVAWNRRYLEMFQYPDGMVQVGRPVADLIRWNAARGELGPGDVEQQVERRLAHMRAGTPHAFQRVRRDGRVYSIQGQPIPGGGFVTTYSDITEFKRTEQALLESKQGLEERVAQRTTELSSALSAQRQAVRAAEAANASKTRFVAAASHDLLQPLNAARLFASALEARAQHLPELTELTTRIEDSMRAAEELLNDLLDIARLDSGALKPNLSEFAVADLLQELQRQYAPLAQARGLSLRVIHCRAVVRSDRVLLRRIVQNYLSNALRYTEHGGVAIGCRRQAGSVIITVYDTGPGIDATKQREIFTEFNRLGRASPWGEKGLGLGLSICERLAHLLEHRLTLSSRRHCGSAFGVCVPMAAPVTTSAVAVATPLRSHEPASLRGLRVLCIDNDVSILAGMQALLEHWGVIVLRAANSVEALRLWQSAPSDVVLADYHLGEGADGMQLLREIQAISDQPLCAALITADHSPELAQAANVAGFPLLHKPVRPAALRAVLSALASRAHARPARLVEGA